jgi:hypothetical protein
MAFEDLKERFQSESKMLWERIQDSSTFIKLREQYENLSPPMQKLSLVGTGLVLVVILFQSPLNYFGESSEFVTEFEDKRQLIRDMMKVSRESQSDLNLSTPPEASALKAQIENQMRMAQLLPEQIKSAEVVADRVNLLPGNLTQGIVKISLSQLNLRQIVDLGYQFQSISSGVKMTDLQMEANSKDPKYYDVVYKFAVLAVPSANESLSEEPEPPPPPPRKREKQ